MPAVAAPRHHIPALDGLRGFAVLFVFAYHYGGGTTSTHWPLHILGWITRFGWSGVTLFFILSGFLITGILWDSLDAPHPFRTFYIRRMLRIFPLYYGSLTLVLLSAFTVHPHWPAMLYTAVPFLFLQNTPGLIPAIGLLPSRFGLFHYWSLAVEEQFYLVWPLMLLWARTSQRALRICITLIGLSLIFRIVSQHVWPVETWQLTLSRVGELALGSTLALFHRLPAGSAWHRFRPFLPLLAATSLGTVLVIATRAPSPLLTASPAMLTCGLLAMSIFWAAIVALSLHPGRVAQIFSVRWLRWFGRISFGMYVFHVLFADQFVVLTHWLFPQATGQAFYAQRAWIAAVGTVSAAWLSFRFLEQPFLRRKHRLAPLGLTPDRLPPPQPVSDTGLSTLNHHEPQ